jgi:hypothetical protein
MTIPADMDKMVEKLNRDLDEIGTEYPKKLENLQAPETIYHYTDDQSFRGIVEHGTLWCTDIFYLNDPSELKYAVFLAMEVLANLTSNGPAEAKLFASEFRRYERGGAEDVAHYFVCSFSSNGDHLGQWRAYADNGRGYAIGFDGRKLETAFTTDNGKPIPEHMTFPVCYDETLLKDIFRRLIEKVIPLISAPAGRHLPNDVVEEYMEMLRIELALQIFRTALFFKHPAYADEHEYRLMQVHQFDKPPTGLKFRSKPYTLLRYREFDWRTPAPEAVKRIVLGPASDPRIAFRFANDCFRAYAPTANHTISRSNIPYRGG